MNILQVRDLSLKRDGTKVLDGLNMDFRKGCVHAVVGPNGAGKSTLAHTIMGLSGYHEVTGDILFEGSSIKGMDVHERAQRGITLAWQEPARFEGLKVRDFIGAAAGKKGRDIVAASLDEVGMDPAAYLGRDVDRNLSGGERKKIELASILAMGPKLAMLDEPDSGIDIDSLERIFAAVRTLREKGTTVLLITHSLAVLRHAEHAFLLCSGRLQDAGDVDRISAYFGKRCVPCGHKNEPDSYGAEP